ncbi:cupin domain-containing protein, partial [Thermodesulfobacteriota bacterium]
SASARKVLTTQGGVQHQLLTHGMKLSFELVIVEIPPGASTGEFLYTHSGEECGFLLEGELSVETNDQVHRLKPGDSITLKSSIPHRVSNPGNQNATTVWVNSAPYIFSTH